MLLAKSAGSIVVHRDILIFQTANKFSDFGISDCGYIKSGYQENRDSRVQITSIQTFLSVTGGINFRLT